MTEKLTDEQVRKMAHTVDAGEVVDYYDLSDALWELLGLRQEVKTLKEEKKEVVQRGQNIGYAYTHAIKNTIPLVYQTKLLEELEKQYKVWGTL